MLASCAGIRILGLRGKGKRHKPLKVIVNFSDLNSLLKLISFLINGGNKKEYRAAYLEGLFQWQGALTSG